MPQPISVVLAAIACSLLVIGCGNHYRRSSSSPSNASQQDQSAASVSAGDCDNALFPVIADESLEYETSFTSNSLAGYIFSVTFTEISDGSFIQHQEVTGGAAPGFYAAPIDAIWKCLPEGLASTEYTNLSRPESRLKLETLDATGVTIPTSDRWSKGSKWRYRYSVRGQMAFVGAPQPVDVEGAIAVAADIAAQEKVEVPAGVYEAFKVLSVYNQALTIRGSASPPINITFTVESWYARDVGLVKLASEDLRVTTVLKSVTK
jgi:hypothetical protein